VTTRLVCLGLAAALGSACTPAISAPAAEAVRTAVDFRPQAGAQLPTDVPLRDSAGRPVRLGDYFGARPVLLMPAWLECPHLCGLTLRALARGVRASGLMPGEDLDVVVLSLDPADGPALAARVRAELAGAQAQSGWHVLTGQDAAIRRVTGALGYRFVRDTARAQIAHPAGLAVLTPQGRLARALYGVSYPGRDVRLAVTEASGGRIGSFSDRVLLRCYAYDPARGRYTLAVMGTLRAAAGATALALGLAVGVALWRERRRRRHA
jgi:protein SCO1